MSGALVIDLHDELVTALAGRYDIERELGHGGMAIVYLARDVKNHRQVALKVLRSELAGALGAERFLQEIAISAPLVHPNIIPLYDSGEASGFLYYTMPFVKGLTLRERLDRDVQLPIEDAVSIARQVAAALDYAHSQHAVHRDIKPENILLLGDHVFVADFGLARAISRSASKPLTSQGLVVGTVPYMSPEQCTPDGKVGPASDIYSLGCVVFEMIAGMTPYRGATADAMMLHHQTSPPPSLREERTSCPSVIDSAVRRALAKVPADRFRTGREFIQAISSPAIGHSIAPELIESPAVVTPSMRRRGLAAVAAATVVAVAAAIWFRTQAPPIGTEAPVPRDTTVLAILPLERQDASSNRGPEDQLFFEAFGRWRGLSLVDAFQITDALRRLGRPVQSDEDARSIADSLGAGRYIRARTTVVGDSTVVYATLYDLQTRRALQHGSVRIAGNLGNADLAFARLADTLLLRGDAGHELPLSRGNRSLPAAQAFAGGERALNDWDLDGADSSFRLATTHNPLYARAHLWLAQVRAWNRQNSRSWLASAERSLTTGSDLGVRDRQLAAALTQLGGGNYDRACHIYEGLREKNERDFAAWYGLGQCRTFDKLVVRDSGSPSGWRFRSSVHRALQAYERALELLPSAHTELRGEAFEPLRNLLLTGRDQLVSGYSVGADSARFLARISWVGDSVTLIPYPWARMTGSDPVYPPGFDRALAYQRDAFRRIAAGWSVALPQSPGAKEALAISLEMLGDASAADTLRLARQLVSDPTRKLQLLASEVIVRVKFALPDRLDQLQLARALADSALGSAPIVSASTARIVGAVAELSGQCGPAVELSRRASADVTSPLAIPRHYYADASELLVRTSMGCPASSNDNLGAFSARVRRDPQIGGPDQRRMVEDILLMSSAQASFPPQRDALAVLATGRSGSLVESLHLFAERDTVAARKSLTRFILGHGSRAPGIDVAYPEARLSLALGDSAVALGILRRALEAVPAYEPRSLVAPGWSSTLVHAMALRAELEWARGDRRIARNWASAVVVLWRNADRDLQSLVRQMRSYTRS